MMAVRSHSPGRRQRGIALPVMLIMLLVMMATSILLLRSTNSTTLAVSNQAYDAALSRAADLGLHTGFRWLQSTADTDRPQLNGDVGAQGYNATMTPNLSPRNSAFWAGSRTIEDDELTRIEYVIHRMCTAQGQYNDPNNRCVTTSEVSNASGGGLKIGDSAASDAEDYADTPRLHYVITARIAGARGGNVVNQMVVMIGT
jgi:hypothetical protein